MDSNQGNIQYVILVLDRAADSFCYYENPYQDSELMPFNVLEKCVSFCFENNFKTTILYGKEQLSDNYIHLLNSFPHVKISHLDDFKIQAKEIIKVINFQRDFSGFDRMNSESNVMLRINLEDTRYLKDLIYEYHPKLRRLNVIFKDIDNASETRLNDFRLDLKIIRDFISGLIISGKMLDINFATDRILLSQMSNCNAGITHFTIAPNGKFYICPGF